RSSCRLHAPGVTTGGHVVVSTWPGYQLGPRSYTPAVMALTDVEVRVLGALIEKERTTPDGYPLSSQAPLSACNQRTSRDPVTDYHLQDVVAAVGRLRDRGLAETVQTDTDRVPKHRHKAAEALGLDDKEAAVMAVLMLRGAQTPGELRT